MRLFQYAVILKPTAKEISEGEGKYELVIEPTNLMAKDENEALLKAARAIPDDYADKMDRIEVAIRPF